MKANIKLLIALYSKGKECAFIISLAYSFTLMLTMVLLFVKT